MKRANLNGVLQHFNSASVTAIHGRDSRSGIALIFKASSSRNSLLKFTRRGTAKGSSIGLKTFTLHCSFIRLAGCRTQTPNRRAQANTGRRISLREFGSSVASARRRNRGERTAKRVQARLRHRPLNNEARASIDLGHGSWRSEGHGQ